MIHRAGNGSWEVISSSPSFRQWCFPSVLLCLVRQPPNTRGYPALETWLAARVGTRLSVRERLFTHAAVLFKVKASQGHRVFLAV